MAANGTEAKLETITPQGAREALEELAALTAPVPSDHPAVAALEQVLSQLAAVGGRKDVTERERCRGCRELDFTAMFATGHFARCPRHPATGRALAVREALRLAPGVVDALHLDPVRFDGARFAELDVLRAQEAPRIGPGRFGVPPQSELRSDLELLSGPKRAEYPGLVKKSVGKLAEGIACWERIFHRELDPCPWCGAVVALGELVGHLEVCERHPAAVVAEEATAALAASLGKGGAEALVELVRERDGQVDGLRELLFSCCEFDGELGWNGTESYARDYVEKDLNRALAFAARRTGAQERGFRLPFDPVEEAASGPAFARPAWRALLRVGVEGGAPGEHAGTEQDAARLKEAAAELLALHEAMGEEVECPACGRSGVWIDRAVLHVATCLAHPAIARQRARSAELALAKAILKGRRPDLDKLDVAGERPVALRLLAPDAFDVDESKRVARRKSGLVARLDPLDFLLSRERRLEHSSFLTGYRDDLAIPLSDWQRYRVAAASECPWCAEALPFGELLTHVAGCDRHPAHRKADAMEAVLRRLDAPRLPAVSRLRAQADRARLATVRLLEYVEAFKGTWGEDERCRATVPRWAEPGWYRALEVARGALKALEAEAAGGEEA